MKQILCILASCCCLAATGQHNIAIEQKAIVLKRFLEKTRKTLKEALNSWKEISVQFYDTHSPHYK